MWDSGEALGHYSHENRQALRDLGHMVILIVSTHIILQGNSTKAPQDMYKRNTEHMLLKPITVFRLLLLPPLSNG